MIVCLAIFGLCGCAPHEYKDWASDAIVFGNIKVIAKDGEDITKFCKESVMATGDYVPGISYSYRGQNRDHLVYTHHFESDGSYFAAAAPNDPTHLNLNCAKILASSLTRETVYYVHIDIGTFKTPGQRAASYFAYLTVHLENDGKITTDLEKDEDARLEKIPLAVTERQLPLIRISLASIDKPTGWSGYTSSHVKSFVP